MKYRILKKKNTISRAKFIADKDGRVKSTSVYHNL